MASYKNDRSLAIMDQEMDLNMICKYIEVSQKEELPQIMEEASDYKSSSYGRGRSPS